MVEFENNEQKEPQEQQEIQPYAIIDGLLFNREIENGYVLKDTLTDELDSFTLMLNNVNKHLFEPFSTCKIKTPENKNYYFYVVTTSESLCNISDNKYNYTIELISQTKILERCILPNLKVRKSIGGDVFTIGYYIRNIVYQYIKKQFPFLTLSSKFLTLTDEMPEIEWQHPSAKQVLNDLLSMINNNPNLVKVENNEITMISLAKKGNDVSFLKDKCVNNDIYETMSNFANNIVMDAQNIVPSKVNGAIYGISPRSESGARLTTDNCELIIPNAKIDKIKKVIVYCVVVDDPQQVKHDVALDITEYILPKEVYNTLPTSAIQTSSDYKTGNLYFTQGGNKIEGLSVNQKFLLSNTPAITNVIKNAFEKQTDMFFLKLNTDIRNLIFDVEYYTLGNARMAVKKDNQEAVDVSLYQTQNQSNIDMKATMKVQRDDVNRLGNEIMNISAVVNYDEIPQLMDYIDDYYLAQREIAFYKDFAIFKGVFSKNYIMRNVYYGLKSRKHFVNLAQTSESIIREDCHYINILVSLNAFPSSELPSSTTNSKYYDLLVKIVGYYYTGMKSSPIKMLGLEIPGNPQIALHPVTYMGDKSVIVTAQTYDNYSVGMKVDNDYIQDYVSYTNSWGTISAYTLNCYDVIPTENLENARNYPAIDFDGNDLVPFLEDYQAHYEKDNAETLKITYQFDFVSNSNDLIIGNAIGENNALALDSNFNDLKLYVSSSVYLDNNYAIIDSDNYTNRTFKVFRYSYGTNSITLEFDGTNILSYALTDKNGEILIGINRNKDTNSLSKTIYFNVKGA